MDGGLRHVGRVMVALALFWVGANLAAATPPAQPAARIVAIGDLHGDHSAWRDIALAAGLVDSDGRWTGGNTVLVQMGDVPDRGPDTLKIIRDLMRLQREAPRAGGRVVALVGNHEAMNMTGDLRYVVPGEYEAFADRDSAGRRARVYAIAREDIEASYRQQTPGMSARDIQAAWITATPLGMIEHQLAWSPQGEIGRWVLKNPAVLLLDGTLFVHGGLSAGYAARSVDDINRRVAAALAARETAESSIINDPLGPLWYRGLVRRAGKSAPEGAAASDGAPASPSAEYELAEVLRAQGAQRIVVGHTPNLAGVAVLHEGRLVQVDTGISSYYGGKLGWLEIVEGRLVPRTVERSAGKPMAGVEGE